MITLEDRVNAIEIVVLELNARLLKLEHAAHTEWMYQLEQRER